MIQISSSSSSTKTIRAGDPDFVIQDGFVVVQRAGFELTAACPTAYKDVILQAINSGWLKPVAVVRNSEYMWDQLGR